MSSENRRILEETHTRYLDALRHREQDILQYLVIFVPAIAVFGWVLHETHGKGFEFLCGSVVTTVLLLLGAVYSWALGYNYRYVVFALVKFEKLLDIRKAMPVEWQRLPDDFLGSPDYFKDKFSEEFTFQGLMKGFWKNVKFFCKEIRIFFGLQEPDRGSPQKFHHEPPEMIYVFWLAFIVLIVAVTGMATYKFFSVMDPNNYWNCKTVLGKGMVVLVGVTCFLWGVWWVPQYFGKKLYAFYEKEKKQDNWMSEEFFPDHFSRDGKGY